MCPNGSSRAPNREVVRRTPLATARTLPCRRVSMVTIRSDSPSFCTRSTTASSRDSLPRNTPPAIGSESQPAQLSGIALPVLGDPYVQVEVDLRTEQVLDLGTRPGTDLLEPAAPGADHDGLLAGPLHVDVGVHLRDPLLREHLLHQHGDRVRQ